MTFADQVTADLPTFLNVDEFGQIAVIDGEQVTCVIVNDEAPGGEGDGITHLDFTLYAKASSFYTTPVVRQRMLINDQPANVTRVDQEQGIFVIRLEWLES